MAANPASSTQPSVKCPLCEGTIPEGSRKCIFCGSVLQPGKKEPAPAPESAQAGEYLANAALGVSVSGIAALWGWVNRLSLLANWRTDLILVLGVTAFATAVLIAIDSSRVRTSSAGMGGPSLWFVFGLVAMPIALPAYLMVRSRFGGANLVRHAAVLGAVLVATTVSIVASRNAREIRAGEINRQMEAELHRAVPSAPETPPAPN
jgi:hypothetical protein